LETQLRQSKEQCSAQEHESKKQLAMAEQKTSFLEVQLNETKEMLEQMN